MTCADLIKYIDQEKSLPENLTPEEIRCLKGWAQKIPSEDQLGHLIPLKKIPSKQLRGYLANLIPDFPR